MAIKTSITPSTKYPGWTGHTTIEYDADGNEIRRSYIIVSELYPYAVNTIKHNGVWYGELMTQQKCSCTGRYGWEIAHNYFDGTVAQVIAEAERRGEIIRKNEKAKSKKR